MGCEFGMVTCRGKETLELNEASSELLRNHLASYPVLVYIDTHCTESKSAIQLLEQKRVKFESFNLQYMSEGLQLLAVLQTVTEREKTPFVFVNRKPVRTMNELTQLLSRRK